MDNVDRSAVDESVTDVNLNTSDETNSYPVDFRGKTGEYFKIWIVNILLTVITFYIYSAWAKVRTKRYFYGNTFVDNSSFEYHARPLQLLPARIIGIILLAFFIFSEFLSPVVAIGGYALLTIATPWIIWRSILFNSRMSSYRNVRFGFRKGAGGLYAAFLIPMILPLILFVLLGVSYFFKDLFPTAISGSLFGLAILSFYLVLPWLMRNTGHYALNGYRYGGAEFSTQLSTGRYYKIYILSVLIGLAALALFALIGFLLAISGIVDMQTLEAIFNESDDGASAASLPLVLVLGAIFYLMFLFMFVFAAAFVQARTRNYIFGQTQIDNKIRFNSTVKTLELAWLQTSNLIAIVLTLGLAYPWTAIRKSRFYAKRTQIQVQGSLDGFVTHQAENAAALGEELGDAFDLDIGVGV